MECSPTLEADFAALADFERLVAQSQFYRLFPGEDMTEPDGSVIHARHKYAKHLEFFEAGAKYRERCFMAANRVGKTLWKAITSESPIYLTTDMLPQQRNREPPRRVRASSPDGH